MSVYLFGVGLDSTTAAFVRATIFDKTIKSPTVPNSMLHRRQQAHLLLQTNRDKHYSDQRRHPAGNKLRHTRMTEDDSDMSIEDQITTPITTTAASVEEDAIIASALAEYETLWKQPQSQIDGGDDDTKTIKYTPTPMTPPIQTKFAQQTILELKEQCKRKGLLVGGNKTTLIHRLEENANRLQQLDEQQQQQQQQQQQLSLDARNMLTAATPPVVTATAPTATATARSFLPTPSLANLWEIDTSRGTDNLLLFPDHIAFGQSHAVGRGVGSDDGRGDGDVTVTASYGSVGIDDWIRIVITRYIQRFKDKKV